MGEDIKAALVAISALRGELSNSKSSTFDSLMKAYLRGLEHGLRLAQVGEDG